MDELKLYKVIYGYEPSGPNESIVAAYSIDDVKEIVKSRDDGDEWKFTTDETTKNARYGGKYNVEEIPFDRGVLLESYFCC